MADKKNKIQKSHIAAAEDFDTKERRRYFRLLKSMKYKKKDAKGQEELAGRMHDLVKSNAERQAYEEKFAHNISVTSKHERRRKFKLRWRAYTFLITGGAVLFLVGFLLYSYVLVVENINVVGTDRYSAEDLISESGLMPGDKLLSLSIDAGAIEERIIDRFPYIKSVKLRRSLPDTMTLVVTEEVPVFVSEVYGEYYLLTEEMRVLERSPELPEGDYIKLKLPEEEIRTVRDGHVLEMDGNMLDVVLRAAKAVSSETMREGTSVLDVRDRFNILISYGGRFRLELGTVNDIDIKLSLAFEIMKSEKFAGGNKGTIYLDDVNRASAIIDNELDLD